MDKNTKPTAGEFIARQFVAEMTRQGINRTQLAKTLGWSTAKLKARLSGKNVVVGNCAEISRALGMNLLSLFEGMNSSTIVIG
jgi:hypothetical protein